MPRQARAHYSPTEYDPQAALPEGARTKAVLRPIYRRDHCHKMDDILHQGLDYSLLKNLDGSNTTKYHKVRDLRQLAKQIAWEFLTTILDELIETGDHYLLPTRNFSLLRICAAPGSVSRKRLELGRYQMVNPFAHEGRTYELKLDFKKWGHKGKRVCRIDLPRYYKLCKLVNQDKVSYDLN